MDDRRKTIAALTMIVGVIVLVVVIVGVFLSRKQIVSPVPDEGAIRVIFISPTTIPVATLEPSPAATSKPTAKPTTKPTVKPTAKPTSAATPSATVKPSPTP